MIREREKTHFDWILFAATLLLMAYGIILIYSATWRTQDLSFVQRQTIFALAGAVIMLVFSRIDYRFLENFYRPIYFLAILSLLAVFLVGQVSFGAQRWLDLRLFPFQPAELAKVLTIIALAKYLADHEEDMRGFKPILVSLLLAAGPIVLIYLQPSLGTAVAMGAVWLAMVVAAGVRLRYLALLFLVFLLLIPVAWNSLLEDYMKERILTFLDPQQDPLGAGYNTNQALIAVGSGGLWGKGLLNGSQSQLQFLRVRHTDYIFSVLGEELGFAGVVALLLLMGTILWRILRAAELGRDGFGRLIACGIAALIGFQSFVNIGMNLGLVPAAGIPLPFVSYGGSSLLALFLALGVVQSIVMRHKKLEF